MNRLFEIGPEQQRIARLQDTADFSEKLLAGGTIEVPDGASQKQNQDMLASLAAGRYFQETIQILALETNDADGIDIAKFAPAHGEGRG